MVAVLAFVAWEAALWAAAVRLARALEIDLWLGALAIEITLESSIAGLFSFAGWNHPAAYWAVALVCAWWGRLFSLQPPFQAAGPAGKRVRGQDCPPHNRFTLGAIAALTAPLLILAARPVEEIDSINYLHYLIDWMANRATPYTFATNYVAFWELSFLPSWLLTRVDVFFPLLALKAVVLLALALWQLGRALNLKSPLLAWAVFGALTMRHYWYEYSGVPTLKNDALHGAGFVLLTLAVLNRRRPEAVALLALGAAFASVKYTGLFLAIAAVLVVVRSVRAGLVVAGFWLITSGHYYLRSLFQHGSPFYPFQINLGPIHLPGTADLSYSSILYNLHDSRLWRALFLPAGGVSPAGLLFPAILAATLLVTAWRIGRAILRRQAVALDRAAACILCGWLLYFRSVYSACAGPGDLAFILNSLNSIRYVDGVLAASELFLVAQLGWLGIPLVAINTASRLLMLYLKLSPQVMLMNHLAWTPYWNDLKPAIAATRPAGLAELAMEDGGYFAGHVVAAGNPVDPSVRSLLPEDLDALPADRRPRFLAVLVTPGSEAAADWRTRYGPRLEKWGYVPRAQTQYGGLFEALR